MFDSLKDKLGSFRKDVEETAAEKAEPLEDDADADLEGDASLEDDRASDASADGTDTGESDGSVPEPTAEHHSTSDQRSVPDRESEPSTTDAESDLESGIRSRSDVEQSSVGGVGAGADVDVDVDADVAEAEDASEAETGAATEPELEADAEPEAETDDEDAASTGFGRKAKSLVRGKFVIEEDDLEGPLQELELALLSSDVEMGVAEQILDNIRDELVGETRRFTESTGTVVEEALREAILDVISVGQFDFDERVAIEDKPLVIVFTGVNGVGKTTSIAKMSRYLEERGFSTVMANGDTYRAGANEQIREHAEILDTKLIAHEQGGDPAAVLYDAVEYAEANDVDVVLGDTAGRLHTDEGLMDQLEKIDRVVDPDMAIFVDEAVAGQDAVNRAREFDAAAPFDGTILTKADADSNGGAAISIAHVTGEPILFLGVGQGYDDLERFDPERMVDRLLDEDEE